MTAWRIEADGLILHVRVTPKSGRDEIVGLRSVGEGRAHLLVKVTAPPENDAANMALRKLIAKMAGVGQGAVSVIAGKRAREKRLKLAGDPLAILARLKSTGISK
ncbi:MAG: DUF167 family protein [Sphingomonadaceae bacterium]